MIRLPEVPGQRGGNCYVYPVIVLFPIILIFIGLPLKVVIAVQKRLCRRNSKWVGLILPAAALVYGLFLTIIMSVVMFHYDGPPMITTTGYTVPAGASSSYEPSPEDISVSYFPDPEHPLPPRNGGRLPVRVQYPHLVSGVDLAEKPAGGAGEGGNGQNEGPGIRVRKL